MWKRKYKDSLQNPVIVKTARKRTALRLAWLCPRTISTSVAPQKAEPGYSPERNNKRKAPQLQHNVYVKRHPVCSARAAIKKADQMGKLFNSHSDANLQNESVNLKIILISRPFPLPVFDRLQYAKWKRRPGRLVTWVTSGRQRIDMRRAVPNRCNSKKNQLQVYRTRSCIDTIF